MRTLGRYYQITTDALRGYVGAIEEWFGADVDYAQLVNVYGRLDAAPVVTEGELSLQPSPKLRLES